MRSISHGRFVLATVIICLSTGQPWTQKNQVPVDVGTAKQFFVDDHTVDSMNKAFRMLNQPVKYPDNPIVRLEPVQKVGGKELVVVSGSVLFDREERLFKMWYEAADYHWTNNVLCYATSQDGIRWEFPNLGLISYHGSNQNNIVFQSDRRVGDLSPGVFKDPIATDPQRRYKMIHKRGPKTTDGVRVAFSPDGIRWAPGPDVPVIAVSDSPNSVLWDPRLKRYVAHTRNNEMYDSVFTREVLHSESEDFIHWGPYGVIMKADDKDPLWGRQFYNMEWMPYEDVYFGFISVYHTLPGMEVKITPGVEWIDKVNIQLTFSRDGRSWTRAGSRRVFLPNGHSPQDFDHSMIYVMQHPIVVGDEIWIYYVGFSGRHWATQRDELQGGAVGLAKLRLDGFVSVDAGEGTVTTKVLTMSGDRLFINADASIGSIEVEILDATGQPIQGYNRDDADRITSDGIRHIACWKGRQDVSRLRGRPIALRFYLDRSKLYSFVFQKH